jgi:DNA invertase Pin-like site-specific DNA recombinase
MKRETSAFAEKDMKTQNEKKRFIELRAKGLSYDKISKELEISKPTLIKWNDELKNEIANLRYFEFESIIAEYSLSKRNRLESFSIILSKALEELKERPFDEISVKDLVNIVFQMNQKIQTEVGNLKFHTKEYGIDESLKMDVLKEKTLPFVY